MSYITTYKSLQQCQLQRSHLQRYQLVVQHRLQVIILHYIQVINQQSHRQENLQSHQFQKNPKLSLRDILISYPPLIGTNAIFKDGGNSAVGIHSFTYTNANYQTIGEYPAIQHHFEIIFTIIDIKTCNIIISNGKLKFDNKRSTLKIYTTDCLSNLLCGLCGSLDDNINND